MLGRFLDALNAEVGLPRIAVSRSGDDFYGKVLRVSYSRSESGRGISDNVYLGGSWDTHLDDESRLGRFAAWNVNGNRLDSHRHQGLLQWVPPRTTAHQLQRWNHQIGTETRELALQTRLPFRRVSSKSFGGMPRNATGGNAVRPRVEVCRYFSCDFKERSPKRRSCLWSGLVRLPYERVSHGEMGLDLRSVLLQLWSNSFPAGANFI